MQMNKATSSKLKTLPTKDDPSDSIYHILLHWLLSLVSFLLALCVLPLLLPISICFRFYRHFLLYQIGRKHKDAVDIAASQDSVWLQDSSVNRAIINTVMFMKGAADIDKFKNAIDKKLANVPDPEDKSKKWFPKVQQYPSQILHRYVWIKEDNFSLDDHVFTHNKCMPETKHQLESMVGHISSLPLTEKKSPWQFILIPANDTTPDDYCIVFRVHHSIADGISLVRLLLTQIVDKVPEIEARRSKPGFGTTGLILRAVKAVFEGPYMIIEKFLYPSDHHILHGPTLTGDKLVSWSKPIDLDLIKKLKNQTSTTVNDVLVSCLAGAFATHFWQNSSNPPEEILAYIPVDIRNPKSKPILDNQFALVFLKLSTNIKDPLALLEITRKRMAVIKSSPEPLINSLIIRYCMARLPNWFTRITFDMFSRKCTVVLSNVPGYQDKLSLTGDTIEDIIFWPPQRGNVGLGISILSYANHVRIGIQCDRALLSNPGVLVEGFVDQVDLLTDALKID